MRKKQKQLNVKFMKTIKKKTKVKEYNGTMEYDRKLGKWEFVLKNNN